MTNPPAIEEGLLELSTRSALFDIACDAALARNDQRFREAMDAFWRIPSDSNGDER
jgi:hypothetical protein